MVGEASQEVRRWYPFLPAVAAKVREDFERQGYRFLRGRRAPTAARAKA